MDHALANKLLPRSAMAAHISLATACRVAKLATMGQGKYNVSPRKGPSTVENNTDCPKSWEVGGEGDEDTSCK